jgi:acyl-CoA reductase-like NAD-dependent aldehyde dehydrogenase
VAGYVEAGVQDGATLVTGGGRPGGVPAGGYFLEPTIFAAGYVWVDDSTRHYFGTPFGGTRNSGTGRQESEEEPESYLEQKVIHTRLRDPEAALARMLGSTRSAP